MTHHLFTSEAVAQGHPDKVADQISDAILDACLTSDPDARVACETAVTTGLVVLMGEITTSVPIDYQAVTRQMIQDIGYDDCSIGFDYRSCGILSAMNKQSPDISQGVTEGQGLFKEQGAGDQGLMFGYACDETPELMPLPILFAHQIMEEIRLSRISKTLPYLRPDGKSQITVEYDENDNPRRIHTVVISTQHSEEVSRDQIVHDMRSLVERIAPQGLLDEKTLFYINPTGRFVVGGPAADAGVTGRKTIVDTYGGMGRHGGGAFSGKDPSKVDRSAAYAARYVAKNIVAAKLARRCELQVSYAIGVPFPVAVKVETFGTHSVPEEALSLAVQETFDLSPKGIAKMLNLKRPIYRKTAYGGHFGRQDPDFTWENVDRVDALLSAVNRSRNLATTTSQPQ